MVIRGIYFTMKKLRFLLIAFLVFGYTGSAHAQIIKSIGFRFGMNNNFADINESGHPYEDRTGISERTTSFPELQLELTLKRRISLLLSSSYLSNGFNEYGRSGGFISGTYKIRRETEYYTFYLAPKYNFEMERITFYGFLGPYVGFLASYDGFYDYKIPGPPGSMGIEKTEQMLDNSMFGGTVGGGFEIKSKRNRLFYSLQMQYLYDLASAADYSNDKNVYAYPEIYNFKMHNKSLTMSIGVHYPFTSGR